MDIDHRPQDPRRAMDIDMDMEQYPRAEPGPRKKERRRRRRRRTPPAPCGMTWETEWYDDDNYDYYGYYDSILLPWGGPDKSTFGRQIWEEGVLVELLGLLTPPRVVIAMGWLCKTAHMFLKERLDPLKGISLKTLDYLHRMARKYTLKECDRFAPIDCSWRLCKKLESSPNGPSCWFGDGPVMVPVSAKVFKYRRTAKLAWRPYTMAIGLRGPEFEIRAWTRGCHEIYL